MKTDKLMNQKELKKAQVLELLNEKKISLQEASKRLGITLTLTGKDQNRDDAPWCTITVLLGWLTRSNQVGVPIIH